MLKSLRNYRARYIVYIIATKYKKTLIGISDEKNGFSVELTKNFSRLVYFKKFKDRYKALNRKRSLTKMNDRNIKSLVSKTNPDWLNIIFTLDEEVES